MTEAVWTDERVAALKKMWDEGLSCSQCAAELSGPPFSHLPSVSRNAAIGKVHRMGLSGRVKAPSAGAPRLRKARPAHAARIARPTSRSNGGLAEAFDIETIPESDNVIPLHQRLSLLELDSSTCHWPIGDPQATGFSFCGAKAVKDKPYCPHHTRISVGR
jgi:GcrA cell cycle regulator